MNQTISWQDYQSAREANPKMFPRELAKLLGVSEAALKQAGIGHGVQRLITSPMKLLTRLVHLGDLLAITDNHSAVNEITGSYHNPRIDDHAGLFLNPGALDLRVFPKRWVSIFALDETLPGGDVRKSIQFFDEAGDAVHRVYATATTDVQQWQDLIAPCINNDAPALTFTRKAVNETASSPVSKQAVEQYWLDMIDVHQFPGLLKEFGLTRLQAFNLVNDDLARKVSNDSVINVLQLAHQAGNDIMIFTGSQGCVQIYTGAIASMVQQNDWLTLKGHNFSCHLKTRDIAESWVVKKPVADGFVTDLELFDAQGMQISLLYGSRQEGDAEQALWREQVNSLK